MFVYQAVTETGEVYEIGSGDSCKAAWENHAPITPDFRELRCVEQAPLNDPALVKAMNDTGALILFTICMCMIVPLVCTIIQTVMAGRQEERHAMEERRRIRMEKRAARQRENERFYRQFSR